MVLVSVFLRLVKWLARVEVFCVAIMLLAALLISIYAIVARNLGFSTGDWALALPELLLTWMTFLGCGALITTDEHIAADFFLLILPKSWLRYILIFGLIITFVAMLPILWGSVGMMLKTLSAGIRDREIFNLPQGWLMMVLPLGFGLCLLHLIGKCIELVIEGPKQTQTSF